MGQGYELSKPTFDVVPQARLYHLPQRAIWELRIKIPEPAWGVSHSNHHYVQANMRTIFPSHDMFEILTLMKFMYCLTLIVTLILFHMNLGEKLLGSRIIP